MSWPEDDWRYGHPDWTYIVDTGGIGRFVKRAPRKRRRAPRALRFADLQPGAVLVHRGKFTTERHGETIMQVANSNTIQEVKTTACFVVVTDRWFDPCAGQRDPVAGEMAATRYVGPDGAVSSKQRHTLRGLAMQGYSYATPEQAQAVSDFVAERVQLMLLLESKAITLDQARLRATPYRSLLRMLEPVPDRA